MKLFVDANLPPRLARGLNALLEPDNQIIHATERFSDATPDLVWMSALSKEGGWSVITADRKILRNPVERRAFVNSRLIGFFLSPNLQKKKLTLQAARLLQLWEQIISFSSTVENGAYQVPEKGNKFRQLS
ncbi:MAG: hypothetical protein AAF607_13090 [Pseudomonadota bacterium]